MPSFSAAFNPSYWLHPTVAITLGATLWCNAITRHMAVAMAGTSLITYVSGYVSCRLALGSARVRQPLSSHGGFYQVPEASNETSCLLSANLTVIALAGLWLSEHHRFTMAWLWRQCSTLYLLQNVSVLAIGANKANKSG
ncbi:hypothetical protein O9992_20910 [Vibrio lentus]|nr:hypothetical protein [Vibrio lentus]